MSTTLNEILGGRNLSGLIQAVKPGIPTPIPESFFSSSQMKSGDTAEWQEVDGTRKLALQVHYGSPAKTMVNLEGVRKRTAQMVHTFHDLPIDLPTLMMLEDENGARQKMGLQEVIRQTTIFNTRFDNLRNGTMLSTLSDGKILFDAQGNFVEPGGSASLTVDFGVPAGNRDQLDVFGSGAIIGTTWATDTTDIAGDIRNIRKSAVQLTGYPLAHAFYGENILEYIFSNTILKEAINRSQKGQDGMLADELPDPFLNLQWHPMNEAFFVNQSGDVKELWGGDKIVFTPEPSAEWLDTIEGSYPVPTGMTVAPDAVSAHSAFTETFGRFSYAIQELNPPGVRQFAGDTFLPMLKVPKAIFIADVTP